MKDMEEAAEGESNQAERLDEGHEASFSDPHLHTSDGKHLNMPGAGVKHGSTVNYEKSTRSDSNDEYGPS